MRPNVFLFTLLTVFSPLPDGAAARRHPFVVMPRFGGSTRAVVAGTSQTPANLSVYATTKETTTTARIKPSFRGDSLQQVAAKSTTTTTTTTVLEPSLYVKTHLLRV